MGSLFMLSSDRGCSWRSVRLITTVIIFIKLNNYYNSDTVFNLTNLKYCFFTFLRFMVINFVLKEFIITHFYLTATKMFCGCVFTNFQRSRYVISVSPFFAMTHVVHFVEQFTRRHICFISVAPDVTSSYNLY